MSNQTFTFRMSKTNRSRYMAYANDEVEGEVVIGSVQRRSVTTSSPRSGVDSLALWTAKRINGNVLGTQYPTRKAAAEALIEARKA